MSIGKSTPASIITLSRLTEPKPTTIGKERVQKILSQWGIASRRQAEQMILAGRVRLNGQVVKLGQTADPYRDRLAVDGQIVKPSQRPPLIYLLLHKPAGVVCTCRDPQGRRTVLDILPSAIAANYGLHPVGRLDTNSTGAILLTNDGALTLSLTHPRYHQPKTYHVWVAGHPSEAVLKDWRSGIILTGKTTLPAQVKVLDYDDKRTLLEIVLTEGRNRQIRRVAAYLGYPVLYLHRTAIGSVQLNSPTQPLAPGDYRFLETWEVQSLLEVNQPLTLKKTAIAGGEHQYER